MSEVLAALAGLGRMRGRLFLLSLGVGSFPPAFVFAAIGVGWRDQPLLALLLAYLLPVVLLPLAARLTRR